MKLLTKSFIFPAKHISTFNPDWIHSWSKYNDLYRAAQKQIITCACLSVICLNLLSGLIDFWASYEAYGFVSFLALSVLLTNKGGYFTIARWIFIIGVYIFAAFLYATGHLPSIANLLCGIAFISNIVLFSKEEKSGIATSFVIGICLYIGTQLLNLAFLKNLSVSALFPHAALFVNIGFILLSVLLSIVYLFFIYEKSEQNLRLLITQLQTKEQEITLQNEELIKLNENLTASQEELIKSHIFLNSVIDNLPLSLTVKDVKELAYVRINKAGEQLMLHKQTEILNKKDSDIFMAGQAKEFIEEDMLVLSSGKAIESEKSITNKNNETKILFTRKLPICDNYNEPMFLLSISEDITPRKQAEQVLKKTVKELQTRNHELDNYVYRISHDLRAPFCSMQGLINLSKSESDPEMLKQYIDLIEKSVMKSDRFIQSVLDHSKILNTALQNKLIDVQSIVSQCFKEALLANTLQDIQLKVTADSNTAFYSDEFRITIIINNLIANAVRFTRVDEAEKNILVNIHISNTECVLTITDNGEGIIAEHLPKVFDMFFRGSERATGSGLGLYIARQAVEVLEGKITVESKVNRGTTFTVVLPNGTKY